MIQKKFRLIPSVLYKNGSVVKSVQFSDHRNVGDLPSTMRVFSRRQADELIIFDLDASVDKSIDWEMVNTCVENCNMPLTYGGGVDNVDVAQELIAKGFDKISINTALFEDPEEVRRIARRIGSSSLVAVADLAPQKNKIKLWKNKGQNVVEDLGLQDLVDYVTDLGVGELIINCIDRDGLMNGYDIERASLLVKQSQLLVLISGGCSGSSCIKRAYECGFDGAVMASIFLWKGDSIPSLKRELRDHIPVREVII